MREHPCWFLAVEQTEGGRLVVSGEMQPTEAVVVERAQASWRTRWLTVD